MTTLAEYYIFQISKNRLQICMLIIRIILGFYQCNGWIYSLFLPIPIEMGFIIVAMFVDSLFSSTGQARIKGGTRKNGGFANSTPWKLIYGVLCVWISSYSPASNIFHFLCHPIALMDPKIAIYFLRPKKSYLFPNMGMGRLYVQKGLKGGCLRSNSNISRRIRIEKRTHLLLQFFAYFCWNSKKTKPPFLRALKNLMHFICANFR